MPRSASALAAAAAAVVAVESANTGDYVLAESLIKEDFFTSGDWPFWTQADPTHGIVDYVGYDDALAEGLIKASSDRIYMAVDSKSVLEPGSRRKSIRVDAVQTWHEGLFVIELDHMPVACGVWPSFWMYGADDAHIWPTWGEFDIIEGAHKATHTLTTLHTRNGCDQSELTPGVDFAGHWDQGIGGHPSDDCDMVAPGQYNNQGCSQVGPEGSYGEPFNKGGGGTFAAEWNPEAGHVRTWFWPKSAQLPRDLAAKKPRPDSWGTPYSYFRTGTACSNDHLQNMHLVFDMTLCGDLGSATFQGACPAAGGMSCEEFVQKNPQNFTEAYWSVTAMEVYQPVKEEKEVEEDDSELIV